MYNKVLGILRKLYDLGHHDNSGLILSQGRPCLTSEIMMIVKKTKNCGTLNTLHVICITYKNPPQNQKYAVRL
jgi:hypothetical protein